jgi:hypothetical protein
MPPAGFTPVQADQYAQPSHPSKPKTGLIVGLATAAVLTIGSSIGIYKVVSNSSSMHPTQQATSTITQPSTSTGSTGTPQTRLNGPSIPTNQGPTATAIGPQIPAPQRPDQQGASGKHPLAQAQANPSAQTPSVEDPSPQPPGMNTPRRRGNEPRPLSPTVTRGLTALGADNYQGAVQALMQAAAVGDALGVARLRSELRRRGHNRISNLVLNGDCRSAQTLFRQLRGAGAAPATDNFGDACRAPP